MERKLNEKETEAISKAADAALGALKSVSPNLRSYLLVLGTEEGVTAAFGLAGKKSYLEAHGADALHAVLEQAPEMAQAIHDGLFKRTPAGCEPKFDPVKMAQGLSENLEGRYRTTVNETSGGPGPTKH